jgi:formate hydrogenlyase subunit 6/NADH:ubiquinone oxidoreductase subunit I
VGQQKMSCTVDKARCNLCGLCVEACPCHSITLRESALEFHCPDSCVRGDSARCCGCFCEEVCPTGALSCTFEIILEKQA